MARDSSGTHTLPAGNPVVDGTTITSSWANTTLDDLSDEITDSLSRSGKGGMTAALRCANGTVGSPSYAFTNDTGVGIYRSASGEASIAAGGSAVAKWTSAGWFTSLLQSLTAVSLRLLGRAATSGTAVGVIIDTDTTYAAGDKILSIRSNTSEKASVDHAGKGSFVGVDAGSQKVTSVAVATASTDAVAYSQIPITVYTSADISDSSGSATYTDITGLSFAVSANKSYWFDADLVTASSLATVGLGIQVTGPAAPTSVVYQYRYLDSSGVYQQPIATAFSTSLMPSDYPTTKQIAKVTGVIVNGANAGTVQLQFACETATAVTVYKGSAMRWKQLD